MPNNDLHPGAVLTNMLPSIMDVASDMFERASRFGLSAALTTPFRQDGGLDLPRLTTHGRRCLSRGCASLTVFGTTGEGGSIGLGEREAALKALVEAGIPGDRLVSGIMASAVEDAVTQARIAAQFGCTGLLLAPPYYFKNVDEDGLFGWFAAVFSKLDRGAARVILYNIPSMTAVPLSVDFIGRLRRAFPDLVAGVKDSSSDWSYTERLLAAHRDLTILVGDERHLAAAVKAGAQGTICGLANVCPEVLLPLAQRGEADARILDLVEVMVAYPVTPAIKALVAHVTGDPAWRVVRPPLSPTPAAGRERLGAAFDALFPAVAA